MDERAIDKLAEALLASSNASVAMSLAIPEEQPPTVERQISTLADAIQRGSVRSANRDTSIESTSKKTPETDSGSLGSTVANYLLSPLIGTVLSIFGSRGDSSPEPELPRFVLPERQRIHAGVSANREGAFSAIDYDHSGRPRVNDPTIPTAPQINVQIQALDARSFLDRSDDLAQAVRHAMLNSHALNDVVVEL